MNTLPPEITRQILQNADIDSCVALGNTCKRLRAICGAEEPLFETKVRISVPWMRPGNDGYEQDTWYGCARLLSARHKHQNYFPISNLTDIHIPARERTVLQAAQEPPPEDDFQSLMVSLSEPSNNSEDLTDHLLKVLGIPDEAWDTVALESKSLVMIYCFVEDGDGDQVQMFVVMDRGSDGQLDIEKAFRFTFTESEYTVKCLNDTFLVSLSAGYAQWYTWYVDVPRQALVLLAGPHDDVESSRLFDYDGVLWIHHGSVFVPYVLDLDTTKKVYLLGGHDEVTDSQESFPDPGTEIVFVPEDMFMAGHPTLYVAGGGIKQDKVVQSDRYDFYNQGGDKCRRLIHSFQTNNVVDLATGKEYYPSDANGTVAGVSNSKLGYWRKK